MAPTVIVGEDESAGDVAAELLNLAEHQRNVRVRTDLSSAAFDVDDETYKSYVGKRRRSEDEQRVNAVAEQVADAEAEDAITSNDELPDSARVGEPGEGDDLTRITSNDELPREAQVAEPPSNGDAPNDGSGFAQGTEPNTDPDAQDDPAPKPRKRTASRARAAKSTSAGRAGAGE